MKINTTDQIQTQNFKGLTISKSAQRVGAEFIKRDLNNLKELAKTCNIKISEGTECMGYFEQACLKVKVTPLKRSLNPFVRLFNLDAAIGKFETELRNIRTVNTSLFALTKGLVERIKAK